LLQNLAHKFGGKMVFPTNLDDVLTSIKENENISAILYEEHDVKEWIHLKWIFFLLLTLLTLEWFVRKRNGAY
jgi:hypothetical protein